MNKEIIEVSVDDIIPNRFQPRINFDEKELKNLADSIKSHGIIQPLVLRRLGDKYEIIAGERRYKASKLAGLTRVPAIIREIDDSKSAELAVIENVQRKNLSSLEEALSYRKILENGVITQEELASRMGIAQSTLANKLRLLNLPQEVQNALLKNQISERHARSLLSLKQESEQLEMLNRIISERLTVKQTDEEISKLNEKLSQKIEEPTFSSIPKTELNVSFNKKEEQTSEPKFDISMLLRKQTDPIKEEKPIDKFDHAIPESSFDINENSTNKAESIKIEEESEQNRPTVIENTFEIEETEKIEDFSKIDSLLEPQKESSNDEGNTLFLKEENLNIDNFNFNNNTFEKFNSIEDKSPKSFEDITPNLDNIFATEYSTEEVELENKPIIAESFDDLSFEDPIKEEITPEKIETDIYIEEESEDDDDNTSYSPLGLRRKAKESIKEIEPIEIEEPEIIDFLDNEIITDENKKSREIIEEYNDVDYESFDMKKIINTFRDKVNDLKNIGIDIDSEEIDFDDKYQIIINIKKD